MKRIFFSVLIAFIFCSSQALARPAPDSFADLAEKLLPSVVNISSTLKKKSVSTNNPFNNGPFKGMPGTPFEQFFDEFFGNRFPDMKQKEVSSLGSGFIVDSKGIIVTNCHVIDRAEEIKVVLSDDTVLEAEVLGKDKKTDIAVLKVKTKKKLTAVEFGNSDKVRIGDWILAIGNPFGLGGTVTAGIISARARDINTGPYDDYLQTDASINRGNSGGPMFDMDGKVIGVNTAIFSPSGGSVGIGFAIPSNLIKGIITDLQKFGRTRRGWLGVKIQTVTDDIAESLGLDEAEGALVASVDKEGPAQDGGVKTGDVILKFDGQDVPEMRKLPRIVASTEIGKEVKMVVMRNGRKKTLRITIGELEEDEKTKAAAVEKKEDKKTVSKSGKIEPLGIEVVPMSDEVRRKYNITEDSKGLVITSVVSGSDVDVKNIKRGDVLVEVNQAEVSSVKDVEKQLEKARKEKRKSLLLLVDGDDGLRFVAVKYY